MIKNKNKIIKCETYENTWSSELKTISIPDYYQYNPLIIFTYYMFLTKTIVISEHFLWLNKTPKNYWFYRFIIVLKKNMNKIIQIKKKLNGNIWCPKFRLNHFLYIINNLEPCNNTYITTSFLQRHLCHVRIFFRIGWTKFIHSFGWFLLRKQWFIITVNYWNDFYLLGLRGWTVWLSVEFK